MTDDPIEKLRAHLEKRRDHAQVFVSVDGLQAVFKELDEARQTLSDWTTDIGVRGFARRSELDAMKARADELKSQRDELKAQVERLLAKEAARIGEALVK
jgi:uncharacterized coiled-coil DUF342 family protein